jgi:hypothetical protein
MEGRVVAPAKGIISPGTVCQKPLRKGALQGFPRDTHQARTNQVDYAIPKIRDRHVALSGGGWRLDISDALLGGCDSGQRSGAVV